ncbi:MAG: hypothetical protein JOZ48_18345 [Acidobacteriaceae bacterium]|nr:hypothetical protein [Streptosporangiaceae bacterium]MBV9766811.1 hypothetical protein [Acidobacteriaceae bacterium]
MSDVIGSDASDQELSRNLGSRQQESRSASFGAGVLASHPGSLAESQQRYNDSLNHHYVQQGVGQLTENQHSALSLGLSPADERTGIFAGQRWLMASSNARSAGTNQAAPILADAGEYR